MPRRHREDIESVTLPTGTTVRVLIDDSGCADAPIGPDDSHVRLVEFSHRHGVMDSGTKRGERSPFSEPEDVAPWAKENRFIVYPVFKYEHGNVAYSTGSFSCPWDSGQSGFLLLSREEWKRRGKRSDEFAKNVLESYASWCNGEIYGFIVEDKHGKEVESVWGFIGDSKYALEEGLAEANAHDKFTARKRFEKLKSLIRNRVPLLKRPAMLESVAYG